MRLCVKIQVRLTRYQAKLLLKMHQESLRFLKPLLSPRLQMLEKESAATLCLQELRPSHGLNGTKVVIPPVPGFLEAPAWETALLRGYPIPIWTSPQFPILNVWPISRFPLAEASLYFENKQTNKKPAIPSTQIKLLCSKVEGKDNSEDRTIANPVSDCMNTMPISDLGQSF